MSPSATCRIAAALAERGIHMLDAPVSGGETGAREGTLSIDWKGAGQALGQIRKLVAINLTLGLLTIAAGTAGRLIG